MTHAPDDSLHIETFTSRHASGIAALCRELGWPTYSDPVIVERGCSAPGAITRVALAGVGDTVVGFAQACGDRVMQSFLSQLAVAPAHRGQGVARRLVRDVFAASGTVRMDLLTDDAHDFYRSFSHREKSGFRLYPE